MSFSIEQLETATRHLYSYNDEYFERNKKIVIDYLSGTTNDLSQITNCARNYQFIQLLNLITKTDDWSSDEGLVMDVVQHPNIFPTLHIQQIPTHQLLIQNTQKAFDKLLKIFRTFNFSDQDIMLHLIIHSSLHPSHTFFPADSPYSTFMLAEIQKADVTTLDSLTNSLHQSDFTFQFPIYHWLDKIDPMRSIRYIERGFSGDLHITQRTTDVLLAIDFNKFIALVRSQIAKYNQTTNINISQAWFTLQLTINKYNPAPDPAALFKEADQYLSQYSAAKFSEPSERRFEFEIDTTDNYRYYELSSIALFIVFSANKEKGFEFFKKIVDHGLGIKGMHLALTCIFVPEETLPFLLLALTRPADDPYFKGSYHRFVLNQLENFPYESYKDELFKFEKINSKPVRNLVVQHIIQHDADPVPYALKLLTHKKADVRLVAVKLLSSTGSDIALKAILESLDAEKNDDARDAMLYSLEVEETTQDDENLLAQLIETAATRGKLKDSVIAWTEEVGLPPVYFKSGRTATQEETRFLFYRMSRSKEMRSDPEARPMLRLIDKDKSDAFAQKLFKAYADKGCDVKQKSLMTIAALIGGDDLVDQLRSSINQWIDGGRKAMAEYGILALAIQGSNKALRWVEWYSRKYKSKKAFVGETALVALDAAAAELNISRHELGDRIVPDFGFEGLFKNFEINGEEYRAFIDNKFKIAFFNEDNKKLKSLPAAASAELKETFKDIAKELRDVVKSQSMRLEYYLVSQRVWEASAWSNFFMNNPIMFTYATRLLWKLRRMDGTILRFICQEDTTLLNKDHEEIHVEEGDTVVMAHPYNIETSELDYWKRWYFEQEMEEVFPQLDRKLYTVDEKNKQSTLITDLNETKAESGAIRSTLEKRGWGKCGDTEGGYIEYFYKEDVEAGVRAIVEVSGVSVAGYDYDNEPTIGRLYFLSLKYKNKPMWLMSPKNETDERLVAAGNIPPVLYSEILSDLHAIKVKALEVV